MLILSVRRLSSYVRIWVDVRFWRIKTVPTLKGDLDLIRGINYKFSLTTAIHRIKWLKNTWICQNKVPKKIIVSIFMTFYFQIPGLSECCEQLCIWRCWSRLLHHPQSSLLHPADGDCMWGTKLVVMYSVCWSGMCGWNHRSIVILRPAPTVILRPAPTVIFRPSPSQPSYWDPYQPSFWDLHKANPHTETCKTIIRRPGPSQPSNWDRHNHLSETRTKSALILRPAQPSFWDPHQANPHTETHTTPTIILSPHQANHHTKTRTKPTVILRLAPSQPSYWDPH